MLSKLFLNSLLLLLHSTYSYGGASKNRCKACITAQKGIEKGLEETANKDWAGGDTWWHEKKGLFYVDSETRLAEVLEYACKDSVSTTCSDILSTYEDDLEEWYFNHRNDSFHKYFCIDRVKACCPPGTYGPKCKDCPVSHVNPCGGHGTCSGEGTREGTGKCNCHSGYGGNLCNECAKGYQKNPHSTSLDCTDIDECLSETPVCDVETEVCRNVNGSFACDPLPKEPVTYKTEIKEEKEDDMKEEECGMVRKALGMFGVGSRTCGKKKE